MFFYADYLFDQVITLSNTIQNKLISGRHRDKERQKDKKNRNTKKTERQEQIHKQKTKPLNNLTDEGEVFQIQWNTQVLEAKSWKQTALETKRK